MASEKTINTRIQLKIDTEENWEKSVLNSTDLEIGHPNGKKTEGTSFKPKNGEAIIYAADNTHPAPRLKIGNGKDNVLTLPFINVDSPIVKQENTTSDKWHKLLLHYNEDLTSNIETADVTNKIYSAKDISVQASSGTIRANGYKVTDEVELYYNSEDKSLDFIFFDEEEQL